MVFASFVGDSQPPDLEGVIFSDLCDAQRRLYDMWDAFAAVPALAFVDLPRRTDMLGVEFYRSRLEQLVERLEESFGQKLTAPTLAVSIRLYNEQRRLWNELRTAWTNGRVPTSQYYALRDLRLTADPIAANAEIRAALEAVTGPEPDGPGCRLLLMGSLYVHRGLIDAVEQDGRVHIVAEDSACDEREVNVAVPSEGTRDQLIGALARSYLGAPAPRLRDLPRRLDYLASVVQSRRVTAVICSYFKFCDLFLAEFPVTRNFFQARGIPVLLLEDEGDAALNGQVRTRLEAFLEMVNG
jgi:benzoyl-CoA reductase/2-hydroxyglutaryl-CoA dehydratase subunit BcrC/BadD/HgdB